MGFPCFATEFAALFFVLLLSSFPAVCESASSADCVAGQTYYDAWSDACLACTTAADCGYSGFLEGSCSVDADAVCWSCFGSCSDAGWRAPDCGNPPGSRGTCELCRVCDGEEGGDGVEVFGCMWYYDTVCANDCAANEYYRVQSQACRACTTCGAGKREFDACYGIDDRTCTHCPEGTWTTSTSPFDTCYDCTENPCSEPWDGDKYVSAPCSAKGDAICSFCHERCGAGEFASGCGFGVAGTCTACSVCDSYAGDYVLAVCEGNRDTICESTCGAGRFWNSFSQECEVCNVCGQGQYANPGCGPTSDAVCFPCGSVDACGVGEFIGSCGVDSGGNVFRTCESCRTCDGVGGNEWFVGGCSWFEDTICDRCPLAWEAPETCGAPGVLYVTANCSVETQTHVQCGECGSCAYGSEWVSRACDDFNDVECTGCALNCPADDLANGVEYYVVHQCGMFGSDYAGPLVCDVATVCGVGEFEASGFFAGVVGAGQPVGHDRVCEFCSTGDCPAGEFESSPCSAWSDRVCSNCSVVCDAPGMYVTGGCGGTSDLECEFCSECGSNEYLVRACNETHDSECAECSVCEAGVSWESQACGGMNDRVCLSCACPAGTYREVDCGLASGPKCVACSEARAGEFVKAGCSATADALIENCTDCWSKFDGFAYTAENCTLASDSVCAVCELCNPGFENASYFEKRCEPFSNAECGLCVVCGESEYEKPLCGIDYDGPGLCNECSRCEGNGVERTAWNCSATSDTICIGCSKCADGSMYTSANCSEFRDTICSPCDVCLGGGLQYEVERCTSEHNTVCVNCTVCSDREFQVDGELCGQNGLPGLCRECAICDPVGMGLYYVENCSSFQGSICGECIGTVENCYRVNETSFSMLQFVSVPCSAYEMGMCETCSMTCRDMMMMGGVGGEEEMGPLYFGDDGLWYVSEDCGPFYDVKCARCSDPCLETQFQVSPCWDSRYHIGHDRVCQNYSSECPAGEFKVSNGSAFMDISCASCALPCHLWPAPGAYEVVGCSTAGDRVCRFCSVLPAGHFIVSACNGTHDAVFALHRTCYPQDGLYYIEFGRADRDAICGSCASCLSWQVVGRENATEYVISECTLTSAGECGVCRPACDQESEWEVVECGGFPSIEYDRECSNLTVCKEGEYEVFAAGLRNNRVCKACGTCANGSEYMVSACNSTSGTVCAECQRCNLYALEQGNAYNGGGCDGVDDRVCLTCSTCGLDEWMAADCSVFGDRECRLCDVCDDDEFFALECTATSNSLCISCEKGGCSSGWFVEQNCSETENVQCAKCSSCSEGTFVQASCTKYADTQCYNCTDSCLAGFYKTQDCRNYGVGGDLQCTRCRDVRCPLSFPFAVYFVVFVVFVVVVFVFVFVVDLDRMSDGLRRLGHVGRLVVWMVGLRGLLWKKKKGFLGFACGFCENTWSVVRTILV